MILLTCAVLTILAWVSDYRQTLRRLERIDRSRAEIAARVHEDNAAELSEQAVFARGLFPDTGSLRRRRAATAHGLGVALLQADQPERAFELLTRAVKLTPAGGELLNDLGTSLFELRRYNEAADVFTQALQQPCRHAGVLSNRGAAFAALGEFAQARSDFEAALQIDPFHPAARRHLELLNRL